MAIIHDKKNGKLTGRFRVQMMVNYQLHRVRVDSLREAMMLETEWKLAKAEGRELPMPAPKAPHNVIELRPAPPAPQVAAPSLMLSQARKKAEGRIWKGRTENNCLGQLRTIEELMGDVELNAITTAWAMDLQAKLREVRKCSDSTVNRYTNALSRFLKWSVKAEHRTVKELPEFELRKENEGRIRWYEPEEEAEMLPLLAERSRKLVRLAILTGGRRGELMRIDARDIFADRVILWGDDTKSGKSRPIPLTDEGQELLKWLVVEGNMPTETMLRDDWDKMRNNRDDWADDEEFVFHGCRHTFAVRAIDKGVSIRVLQKWMGHENVETTERYAKVSGKALFGAREQMFGEAV